MKSPILLFPAAIALCGVLAFADPGTDTAKEILRLERQALDGWLFGNPDALLAVMDPQITYFHIMTGRRLDGLPAVRALFEEYRGKPLFDRYEIVDPKVQIGGDMAVLTYILVTHNGDSTSRWNATQVYQQRKEGWRVVHAHWSRSEPSLDAGTQP
jgi:hypothetical protein